MTVTPKFKLSSNLTPPILSLGLGVFDGMHQGHQEIAKACTALLTFYPHPDKVLKKNIGAKALSTLAELRHYFPHLLVLHFTKDIAKMSPKEFLDSIILTQKPKQIVVGYDFKFGSKKTGDIPFLKKWALKNNIKVIEIPPKCLKDKPIKSSAIRQLLLDNNFEEALQLLGHSYLIIGTVTRGEGRGKKIGFPTANLKVPRYKQIPESGVYFGNVEIKKKWLPAMIYIGKKGTFGTHPLGIEVHILNFEGNLYKKRLTIEIHYKIREDMKFLTTSHLIAQIQSDILSIQK